MRSPCSRATIVVVPKSGHKARRQTANSKKKVKLDKTKWSKMAAVRGRPLAAELSKRGVRRLQLLVGSAASSTLAAD